MGACHATERIHSSSTKRRSLEKQNTAPSSAEKKPKNQEEYSELDLDGDTLPQADLYVSNLNISPSLVIFFGSFYKKRITLLQNSDSLIGKSRAIFTQKLAYINSINIETAQIWVQAYIDYMILMAWYYFAVEEKELYAPFAIQQTQRLHLSYPSDYKSFCSLITEGKNFIHYSPKKTVCNNHSIDLLESLYDEAKESIMIYIYESKQISLETSQETEQIKELWESFYETFIKNEYSFYLSRSNSKASKSIIQKAISDISTDNHNFSLVIEGPSLLRSSLSLSLNTRNEGNTVLSALASNTVSEEERNIARIVDEIKFPIGFSHLLSWEQVISLDEAQEWVNEYKKFVFLNLLGKNLTYTLSRKIKQVWILHMSFTKNYKNYFIEHLAKNNLKMTVSIDENSQENGEDISGLYRKYFGAQKENLWTLTAEDEQSQLYVNFYSDIVKKQEELLSIKLTNALTE